jgi:nucleoside-diphosphate-sugar epimerase
MHILITGAAGDVGTRLSKLLKNVYPRIRLSDIRSPTNLTADDEFIAADLADYEQVKKITTGIDGVLHLGGHSLVVTIFLKPRTGTVSNAWSLHPPTTPLDFIRATGRSVWM